MPRYAFEEMTLDTARRELRRGDALVDLQPQVFDVLAHLVEHADRAVSKEELLDAVWQHRFVSESALSTRIKEARQAVGDDGRRQAVIRTLHGRGFRFVAPVEPLADDVPPTSPEPVDEERSDQRPIDQELRFCTTDDGVRLAYAVSGEGPPLVKVANWLTNIDFDHATPVWRHWIVELSQRFRLVRYDERGAGLSDWEVDDFSLEAWVRDLDAVVDAAGLERFPLLGISQGGAVAIAYAAAHPERVSHLVLLGAFAQGRRARARTPEEHALTQARIDLVRVGWGRPDPTYRQVFVARFLPEGTQEEWRTFDELQRRSTSPENAVRFLEAFADLDVADLAATIETPTLVCCARDEPDNVFEESRRLASMMRNARLVPLDSCNHLLPEHDPAWPVFLGEVEAFLAAPPGD